MVNEEIPNFMRISLFSHIGYLKKDVNNRNIHTTREIPFQISDDNSIAVNVKICVFIFVFPVLCEFIFVEVSKFTLSVELRYVYTYCIIWYHYFWFDASILTPTRNSHKSWIFFTHLWFDPSYFPFHMSVVFIYLTLVFCGIYNEFFFVNSKTIIGRSDLYYRVHKPNNCLVFMNEFIIVSCVVYILYHIKTLANSQFFKHLNLMRNSFILWFVHLIKQKNIIKRINIFRIH